MTRQSLELNLAVNGKRVKTKPNLVNFVYGKQINLIIVATIKPNELMSFGERLVFFNHSSI